MDWITAIAKSAASNTPFTSWIVTLLGEKSIAEIQKRVKNLEDPISTLHEDVPILSGIIYKHITTHDSINIHLSTNDYERFAQALVMLDSQGYIKGKHTLTKKYYAGIQITCPNFIMYMCVNNEKEKALNALFDTANACRRGESLRSLELSTKLNLPNPIIQAVFKICESYGLGKCSNERSINTTYYGMY